MKQEKFVTPEVNLLPQDDMEQHPGGKFLKWALSWGKKIIVLIELIVVIAFLSRFKLDSDVANNSEEIARRKTIILASKDFEKEFRQVQTKVNKVKSITSLPNSVTIYDVVQTLIPSSVNVGSISITGTKVNLEGEGEDSALSKMVADFKSSPDFSDVVLEKVTKQGDSTQISFSLSAEYTK